MMFIKLPTRVVNTAQIVEVKVYEGERLRVEIVTTAPAADFARGAENSDPGFPDPYRITLWDEDAELFLAALPVYEPAFEPGSPGEARGGER